MSFDRTALINACQAHGPVARVVVAGARGSVPREVGASMLVWDQGMSGTIGGGRLEYQATFAARRALTPGRFSVEHHALGPALGQCCGGAVDLLTEVFNLATALSLPENMYLRGPGQMPLEVARIENAARAKGQMPLPQMISGWMVEPIKQPGRQIWIWGAGHVGRALCNVLAPLPGVEISLIDTHENRFPDALPPSVQRITAGDPARLVAHAPRIAEHLIVTYSHTLDLELCHRLLAREFDFAGLIGSKTKWARFRKRLAELGHTCESISRITCPIGRPEYGKHPHQIALGVATAMFERKDQPAVYLEGHG